MIRLSARIPLLAAVALASSAMPGCSDNSSSQAVDTKAAIEKATGGDGSKARLNPKAKAASDAAAKSHPKLY